MTKILALDLAYSGPSGVCVWDGEPIEVSTFDCRSKVKASLEKDWEVSTCLASNIANLVIDHTPDWVAYEYTDWHRALSARNKNWKIQYKIERQAQWSLGMANAIIIMALATIQYPRERVLKIGANEAKREFGVTASNSESATLKEEVAKLIAQQYPDKFAYYNHKNGFLKSIGTDESLPSDVSDAIMIAQVAHGRIMQSELAMG